MDQTDLDSLASLLRGAGIHVAEGLSDQEVVRIEHTYKFRFPPDLRALLQYVLPVADAFPNWRDASEESLRSRLAWPADGICFDIEHAGFWMAEWGLRPADLATACQIARREIAKAPKLIPIYAHRYIPDEPHLAGNPIFSVYQTDIIYYGRDLAHYFANEFASPRPPWVAVSARPIRFWDQVAFDS
jgi:hypothetical protein